ncbi:MAG: phage portal protein [Symbiobacterium thermophilum]|uniref:Phage portal protein n=1 Tax=Symbiobacterium thermophilum TaxID=2734 RepID=A0A953HZ99_SYMTR|nr:phage portal protein [Symbiobacterium thermophilum]
MGVLSRLWENRTNLASDSVLSMLLSRRVSVSGVTVTELTAIQTAAVYQCAAILANNIGTLPLPVYERLEVGKRKATEHPLYKVLNRRANPWMTAATARMALMLHLALWNEAFAHIEWGNDGTVRALWPLLPNRTRTVAVGGQLFFDTTLPDGTVRRLRQDEVLHITGLTLNGVDGLRVIQQARETLGLLMAAEGYAARFFGSGANPGGVVTTDMPLTTEQKRQLAEDIAAQVKGLNKAHEILVLSNGAKFTPIGLSPANSQLVEVREFQIREVARFFNMPPHKLGLVEKGASYASIEQQQIAFLTETLRPWLVLIEQAINATMFSESEVDRYFVEHNVEGLLRGDTKSRYEAYHLALADGWLNRDEVREKENLNPIPGGAGQVFLVPLNMGPAQTPDEEPEGEPEPKADEQATRADTPDDDERALRAARQRQRLAHTWRRVLQDADERIVRREKADVLRKAREILGKRDAQTFEKWLDEFYLDHPKYIERQVLAILLAYAEAITGDVEAELGKELKMPPEMEQFAREYVEAFAKRHADSSLGQLKDVLRKALAEGRDPVEALEERLTEWEQTRPEKTARRESNRAANAFAKAAYAFAGVLAIRWNAVGDSCPYCQSLHGKVIDIHGGAFARKGVFQPFGADKPLTLYVTITHPPLHDGCDCYISRA